MQLVFVVFAVVVLVIVFDNDDNDDDDAVDEYFEWKTHCLKEMAYLPKDIVPYKIQMHVMNDDFVLF